jgi:hypothetical protein
MVKTLRSNWSTSSSSGVSFAPSSSPVGMSRGSEDDASPGLAQGKGMPTATAALGSALVLQSGCKRLCTHSSVFKKLKGAVSHQTARSRGGGMPACRSDCRTPGLPLAAGAAP